MFKLVLPYICQWNGKVWVSTTMLYISKKFFTLLFPTIFTTQLSNNFIYWLAKYLCQLDIHIMRFLQSGIILMQSVN